MGNYLAAMNGKECLDSTRIGTNGSLDRGWLPMLLAGYAVGRFKESDRVRHTWITERPLGPYEVYPRRYPHHELGLSYAQMETAKGWKQIIAYGEDAHYIDLAPSSIDRGRKLKPITCPILEAIMWIYDNHGEDHTCYVRLVGDEVQQFAEAHAAVMPFLIQSKSWYGQLLIHERIINVARDTPGSIIEAS